MHFQIVMAANESEFRIINFDSEFSLSNDRLAELISKKANNFNNLKYYWNYHGMIEN